MNYSDGARYEAVENCLMNTWNQTRNFVIMNERSANIVNFIRFGVDTYLLKGILPNIREINE